MFSAAFSSTITAHESVMNLGNDVNSESMEHVFCVLSSVKCHWIDFEGDNSFLDLTGKNLAL